MPVVSYAQFKEDIYILRALRGVSHTEGFYVDVGANDPEIDSVTKLFYDHGWRGVNIEPSPTWYSRLVAQRPRDINIQAVVSDDIRSVTFYDHPEGGLGTIVESITDRNARTHNIPKRPITVSAITLEEIFSRHAPKQIHFLKIDVEGSEQGVLRSMDFNKHRPWVMCIEAFEPLSDIPTHEQWENIIINAGYKFVLADHANRFYMANEHLDRAAAFSLPLDDYIHTRDLQTVRDLENRVMTLEGKLKDILGVLER